MASYVPIRPDGDYFIDQFWRDQRAMNYGGDLGGYGSTRDNNDGTWLYPLLGANRDLEMNFTSYTLAADQRCAGMRLVSRVASYYDNHAFNMDCWLRPVVAGDGGIANYKGPINGFTTLYNAWYSGDWSQSAINQVRGCYRGNGNADPGGGALWSTVRLSESYIDLDIRSRPTVNITSPAYNQKLFPTRPTINWNYNAQGDAVAGWRFKVFTAAVVEGGGFNPDASPAVTDSGDVGGGANSTVVGVDLGYGNAYYAYVQVATDFLGGWWRSLWAGVRFIINAPPVISAVSTSPATPITTTNQPFITGTYTDPDSDAASQMHIKVFSEAQYGAAGFNPATSTAVWDSGALGGIVNLASGGSFNRQVGVGLSPNTNFKAYVRATEEGAVTRWSPWAGSNVFVITTAPGIVFDPPAIPEIQSVATDQPNQRVVIGLQGRGNLLTRNQASIDTGIIGWQSAGVAAIFQRDATLSLQGGASLAMVPQTTGGNVLGRTGTATAGVPVQAGRTYTGLGSARAAAGSAAKPVHVEIEWYDSAGALVLPNAVGASVTDSLTAWTQATVTGVAPPTAVYAALLLVVEGVASGKAHNWDNMSLAPGASANWTRGGFVYELRTLSDTFNRADNASSLGTADTGQVWTALSGTWGINGNRAYTPYAAGYKQAIVSSNFLSDGFVEADIILSPTPDRTHIALLLHGIDNSNFILAEVSKNPGMGTGSHLRLLKRVANAYTVFAQVDGLGLLDGSTHKLRAEFYGGQIYAYLDGVLRASYLMLAGELDLFGGAGGYGIHAYHAADGDDGGSRWDNFKAALLPTQRITLQRSLDAGSTWEDVRRAVDMDLGPNQRGTVYDYEVPAGRLAQYRASAEASEATNVLVSSTSAVVAQPAALATDTWWLKDAVDPSLNMTVKVAPPFNFTRKEPMAIFDPMGRRQSVFVSDGAKGIEGTLNVWVKDKATYDKLVAILGNGRALLLSDPLGRSWWVKFANQEWGLLRAQPSIEETAPIRHAHQLVLPFVEVSAPAVV